MSVKIKKNRQGYTMEKLIALLNDKFIEFTLMIFVIFVSFFIYLTSTTEPMRSRIRGGVQGALIAAVAAYPVWTYIGNGNLAALVLITIILCISGQFLIEPVQKAVPKYLSKLLTRIEGFIDKLLGGR